MRALARSHGRRRSWHRKRIPLQCGCKKPHNHMGVSEIWASGAKVNSSFNASSNMAAMSLFIYRCEVEPNSKDLQCDFNPLA